MKKILVLLIIATTSLFALMKGNYNVKKESICLGGIKYDSFTSSGKFGVEYRTISQHKLIDGTYKACDKEFKPARRNNILKKVCINGIGFYQWSKYNEKSGQITFISQAQIIDKDSFALERCTSEKVNQKEKFLIFNYDTSYIKYIKIKP